MGYAQDSDFDLFLNSGKDANEKVEMIFEAFIVLGSVRENAFNRSFTALIEGEEFKVQSIKFNTFVLLENVLDSFDFTICQCGMSGNDKIFATENAMLDLSRKLLVPHKITYPVASIRRILKYTNQGYYMCSGSMQDFLLKSAEKEEAIKGNPVLYLD